MNVNVMSKFIVLTSQNQLQFVLESILMLIPSLRKFPEVFLMSIDQSRHVDYLWFEMKA